MTKPTIVVVGCLPAHEQRIEQACGQSVRLRFVESEKGRGKNVSLPSADHVILCVKFIGHRFTETANKYWPRSRVHYHRGGIKELTTKVQAIAAQAA